MLYSKLELCQGFSRFIRSLVQTSMRWILISLFTGVVFISCGKESDSMSQLVVVDESLTSELEILEDTSQDTMETSEETSKNKNETEEAQIADTNQLELQCVSVYICGAVRNPGVYEMDASSRIVDALECAGGFAEGAMETYLNQAEVVLDGQMIYVPTVTEVEDGYVSSDNVSSSNVSTNSPGDSKVNINVASREELMTLTGIGESKADSIIDYRETQGEFHSPEDLLNISGIKEGVYNNIKDEITV